MLPILVPLEANGGGGKSTKLAGECTSLTQNCFLVFGLCFRKRGKLLECPRKKKKGADSKTAILILAKNRGPPLLRPPL